MCSEPGFHISAGGFFSYAVPGLFWKAKEVVVLLQCPETVQLFSSLSGSFQMDTGYSSL